MSFDWLKNSGDFSPALNNSLPVSVVLVVIKSRLDFVNAFVLPALKANNPAEIIVVDDDDLSNQEKRNKGAALATQKYLFVCDDDVVMPTNHLQILCQTLEDNASVAFAYTDYQAVVMDPSTHPKGSNYYQKSRDFDLEYLKVHNYIDTCSLVRKDVFPGFDPEIKRFQDWDLWLTIALSDQVGIYVKSTGIIKFYLDEGITSKAISAEKSRNIILNKHALSGYMSALFIDTGFGFNSNQCIPKELKFLKNNIFEFTFDLTKFTNIKRLRFDPIEGSPCTLKFHEIYFLNRDGKSLSFDMTIVNGEVDGGNYVFNTTDPQVLFDFDDHPTKVIVNGELVIFNLEQVHTDAANIKTLPYKFRSIKSMIRSLIKI